MDKFSYLGSADVGQIDSLYKQFLHDPNSVEESWKEFFDGFEFARTNYSESPSADKALVPEKIRKVSGKPSGRAE